MITVPTITSRVLRGLDTYMDAQGLHFSGMAKLCNVDISAMGDIDGVISLPGFMDLLELAAKDSGDDCFGLKLGLSNATASAGLFHYIVISAPTLADALKTSVRFFGLASNGYSMSFREDDSGGCFYWSFPENLPPHMQFTGYVVAKVVERIRLQLCGVWSPLRAEFQHAAPRDASNYVRSLCRDVRFDQQTTHIVIGTAALHQRMAGHDPRLHEFLQRVGLQRLGLPAEASDRVLYVAEAIRKQLSTGEESMARVAASLGITEYALTKELAEAGYSYRNLVDEVRRGMAKSFIEGTDMSLTEIAYLVGFSELSAFSRAAKNWFGETPSAMRKRAKGVA